MAAWGVEKSGIAPLLKRHKVVPTVSTSVEIGAAMPITLMDMRDRSIEGLHPAWIVDCPLNKNGFTKHISYWVAPTTALPGERILGRLRAFVAHEKFHAIQ